MTSNLHSFEISLVTGLETTFRTPFVGIVALKIHARNQFYIYIYTGVPGGICQTSGERSLS